MIGQFFSMTGHSENAFFNTLTVSIVLFTLSLLFAHENVYLYFHFVTSLISNLFESGIKMNTSYITVAEGKVLFFHMKFYFNLGINVINV